MEWIKCSERMPNQGDYILYFCDGIIDCGFVTSKNYRDIHLDNHLYVLTDDGGDLILGIDVSHWIPIPDEPSQ